MPDILEKRYEQYFRHPDYHHDVLRPGDRALACMNLRQALRLLDVEAGSDHPVEDDVYDEAL